MFKFIKDWYYKNIAGNELLEKSLEEGTSSTEDATQEVERDLDISPPVQTIVELIKKSPKDFKVVRRSSGDTVIAAIYCTHYTITHIPSNLSCMCRERGELYSWCLENYLKYDLIIEGITLTTEETDLLVVTWENNIKSRKNRYNAILRMREERSMKNKRKQIDQTLQEYL